MKTINDDLNQAIENLQQAQDKITKMSEFHNIDSNLEFTSNLIKEAILENCDVLELPDDFVNSLNDCDITIEGIESTTTNINGFDVYNVKIKIGKTTFSSQYTYYQNGSHGWELDSKGSSLSGFSGDVETFNKVRLALEGMVHDNQYDDNGLENINKENLDSLDLLSNKSKQSLRDILLQTADLIK